jgi:hypothetical protein
MGHDRPIRLARGEAPELLDLVTLGIHGEAAAGALDLAVPPVGQRDPDGAAGEEVASHRKLSLGTIPKCDASVDNRTIRAAIALVGRCRY